MSKQIIELEQHAKEWEQLASEQENTEPGRNRANTYRLTAESFRMEIKTGKAHCVCCLKPFGRHNNINT